MLESEAQLQLQRSDSESLIAWSETGKAFKIEDVTLFSTLVLPKYFRTNKFSSFQRNLNLYGFTKLRRGPDADMYAHPSFLRGCPEMLSELKKCKSATAATAAIQNNIQVQISRKKSSLANDVTSSKGPVQPVPLVEGFTRAVSPSSGSDEDSFSRLNSIARHCYGPKSHPHTTPTFPSGNLSHNTSPYHNFQKQQEIQATFSRQSLLGSVTATASRSARASTLAESNGKLNLLTLAVTCLAAESSASQPL